MQCVLVVFTLKAEREEIPHFHVLSNFFWGNTLPGNTNESQSTAAHGNLTLSPECIIASLINCFWQQPHNYRVSAKSRGMGLIRCPNIS